MSKLLDLFVLEWLVLIALHMKEKLNSMWELLKVKVIAQECKIRSLKICLDYLEKCF